MPFTRGNEVYIQSTGVNVKIPPSTERRSRRVKAIAQGKAIKTDISFLLKILQAIGVDCAHQYQDIKDTKDRYLVNEAYQDLFIKLTEFKLFIAEEKPASIYDTALQTINNALIGIERRATVNPIKICQAIASIKQPASPTESPSSKSSNSKDTSDSDEEDEFTPLIPHT